MSSNGLERFDGDTFKNENIVIDNKSFENCQFNNCTIIYRGSGMFNFAGNQLHNCNFSLDGAAANTLEFLRILYHRLGEGGRRMVEQAFENIRNNAP